MAGRGPFVHPDFWVGIGVALLLVGLAGVDSALTFARFMMTVAGTCCVMAGLVFTDRRRR